MLEVYHSLIIVADLNFIDGGCGGRVGLLVLRKLFCCGYKDVKNIVACTGLY